MVPAPMVGTEAAYVYYSGPADAFEAHRATLATHRRHHALSARTRVWHS